MREQMAERRLAAVAIGEGLEDLRQTVRQVLGHQSGTQSPTGIPVQPGGSRGRVMWRHPGGQTGGHDPRKHITTPGGRKPGTGMAIDKGHRAG